VDYKALIFRTSRILTAVPIQAHRIQLLMAKPEEVFNSSQHVLNSALRQELVVWSTTLAQYATRGQRFITASSGEVVEGS